MAQCGTTSGYTGGCRCDGCKKAHAEYQRVWVERNRERWLIYLRDYYHRNKKPQSP